MRSFRRARPGPIVAAGAAAPASPGTPARPRPAPGGARTLPRAAFEPGYLALERSGELARRESTLWELMRSCQLCPRRCGVNRLEGEAGVCGAGARVVVHGAGPHFGEETPLVGYGGSGTIFFAGCNLLCCYCQNWEIAHAGEGHAATHLSLAGIMLDLQQRGCHNINVVTPTHVVAHIVTALRLAARAGLRVPLVYNTGGYDSLEVLALLDGVVDVYLPDFKYQDGAVAARFSSGAADYPEVAAAAIKAMNRQVGDLVVDENGIALRGLMIRHLVLPDNFAGTDRFVAWVRDELNPRTYVNVMPQYRPAHRAWEHAELARGITGAEWQRALRWAREAGLTNPG